MVKLPNLKIDDLASLGDFVEFGKSLKSYPASKEYLKLHFEEERKKN